MRLRRESSSRAQFWSRMDTSTTWVEWLRWQQRPTPEYTCRLARQTGFRPLRTWPSRVARSSLIGPFAVRVLAVPGHSPAHVAYLVEDVLLSGDVLFAGSVGRTDIEGSDPAVLDRTLRMLVETLPPETRVFPGHGPDTTIARERATNPFLAALR